MTHSADGPLHDRSALITGASQGLGLAIARAYVEAGASVMLCARDAAMLETARADVAALARQGQAVRTMAADVSRREDVAALAEHTLSVFPDLQILVNNAGVLGPIGRFETVDLDAWEQAISINLLGSAYCCRALLPHFRRRGYGKVVQLSGGGAASPLPRMTAYAASKAAVVRLAETLADEVRDGGIDVNAIAPGMLKTRLLDQVIASGPDAAGHDYYARTVAQSERGGAPMTTAAALAVYLGSAASDGITGKLLAALWDPWSTLHEHVDDLRGTDVYTIRRIVPADRGLPWGRE